MEFEFNLGEQNLTPPVKRDDTLYASVLGSAAQLSADELVFLEHQTNLNHLMSMSVLNALSITREFNSLHNHIANIQQLIPELRGQSAAIEKVLGFLKEKKLLITDKEWLDSLGSEKKPGVEPVPYAGIVIRTHHRPDSLRRLLESIQHYSNQHNREDKVLVFDDSSDKQKIESNMAVCEESSLDIQYYGLTWQQQFITMLKKSFPEAAKQIDWLLAPQSGFTGGRVWNLALLSLAGKKFAFYDDDYLIQPRVTTDTVEQLNMMLHGDLSVGFGLNIREIKTISEQEASDVLGNMIDACGSPFYQWFSGQSLEMGSLRGIELPELQLFNTGARIKTVGQGTWGSPRATSNYWLYSLTGEQREAFWKDRTTYLENIEAAHLLHYSKGYEVLKFNRFAPSVIDNADVPAFAMPVEGNEDHFFSTLMLGCYPNQVSLHFPHMMGHIQEESRSRSSMNHLALQGNLNRFIGDYFLSVLDRYNSVDPGKRMHILASCLDDLASSSSRVIENRLREYRNQLSADLVLNLQQQLLNVPDAPIYWQADVREIIETNAEYLRSNHPPYLSGWHKGVSVNDMIHELSQSLTQVSDAMKVWPDLWAFCKVR